MEDNDPPTMVRIRATDTRGPEPPAPPSYAHATAEPCPRSTSVSNEGAEGAEGTKGAEGIEGTEAIELVVVTRVIKPSSRVAA